ncbi:MAG: DUF4349 domain-containing protein [Bacteroidales bacterium]|jgi:hypothetical protein|nr:DUF4349 domain-containing protein [Bacteroidales bacterium]
MKKFIFSILIIATIFFSCGNEKSYKNYATDESVVSEEQKVSSDFETDKKNIEVERKIIKTGDISFETSDMKKTRNMINQIVNETKSYISSDVINDYSYNYTTHNYITIRIPSNKFDTFLSKLSQNVEKYNSMSITANDVTEEYVDIESRIKAKKELENRYLDLLKRANSVEDILKIEENLGVIREEIESVEGRLKFLSNQVAYGTLTIDFYTTEEVFREKHSEFFQAFKDGWENLMYFFQGLLTIWPFIILIGAIAYLIVYLIRRKHKNRRKNQK